MDAIFLTEQQDSFQRVFSEETIRKLETRTDLCRQCCTKADILENPDAFRQVKYIFSTWGMPSFPEREIREFLPNLRCVFYAAGSVQEFARPFLQCGVRIISAWAANAVPVAEYTLAQIILANKGFFSSSAYAGQGDRRKAKENAEHYPGNYDTAVGIIGAGMIGKMVIRKLKEYRLSVKVFDPFLSEADAQALGVCKCSLEELFSTCQVVSNHLANNARTRGMLTGRLFALMVPYGTFLNTGRGAQVAEQELAAVLQKRPDLTAILDVTDPEPPREGHAFYTLPNCILSPHIAGSNGREVHRMAQYMVQELERYLAGEPLRYEVGMDMLKTMA